MLVDQSVLGKLREKNSLSIQNRRDDVMRQADSIGYFGDQLGTVTGKVYQDLSNEKRNHNDQSLRLVGLDLPETIIESIENEFEDSKPSSVYQMTPSQAAGPRSGLSRGGSTGGGGGIPRQPYHRYGDSEFALI